MLENLDTFKWDQCYLELERSYLNNFFFRVALVKQIWLEIVDDMFLKETTIWGWA